MQFCEKHWSMLRAAIDARGLTPLVAHGGAEAAERLAEELAGTATEATYDPLMACHWMIAGNAMQALGAYILAGNYCPVCEVLKAHGEHPCEHGCTGADLEERWINGPADAALEHVRGSELLRTLAGLTGAGEP